MANNMSEKVKAASRRRERPVRQNQRSVEKYELDKELSCLSLQA